MNQIADLRTKLVELYQKVDFFIKPLSRFLLALIAFVRLRKDFSFDPDISGFAIIILLSLISALVPAYVSFALMAVYLSVQLANVSAIMSITVILILIVMYCFFVRLTSQYSAAIIGMPLLIGIRIPYVLPISFGLFSTPVSIIPCCLGVFVYYFLKGLKSNLVTLEQLQGSDDPFRLYVNIVEGLIKNESMFAAMIVFSIVIIAMYLVRSIRMDYSFEISVAVGTLITMLVYIILMLQMEVGVSLSSLLIFSVISGLIVLVFNYLYRPLYYAGTERVQFEDDDYYYFVKAVPKIKTAETKVSEKTFVIRRRSDGDFSELDPDDELSDEDYLEANK